MTSFKDLFMASFMSALMYSVINDVITGSSSDIIAPLFSYLIPGEIQKPVKIGRIRLFLNRWMVRVCNLLCGLLVAYNLHAYVHLKNKMPSRIKIKDLQPRPNKPNIPNNFNVK